MPKAWSDKRERQYKHIKTNQEERGASEQRAKEIAARTVNKQRRKSGKTSNKSSMGTGNPNAPLKKRTRRELYNKAKAYDISGRSSMNKEQLIQAIQNQA